MKLFVILALFGLVESQGQETNAITSKVYERDRDKDGKTDVRIETFYRGKDAVLRLHTTVRDGVTNVARTFMVGGDAVMMEFDEGGDGVFETIFAHHLGTKQMEVFERKKDGTMAAVSSEVLAAHKKKVAAIEEFFDKPDETGKDLQGAMRKVREKIREAEAELKTAAEKKRK